MLSIGKFAEAGGVGVETIRFYQRKGLLIVPESTAGSRRYGDGDLQQLHFIRTAQTAGFTLDEIKQLIALDATVDRSKAYSLAKSRLQALDAKILELERARDSLRWLAKECGEGAQGPCPILEAFGISKGTTDA